MGRLPATWAGKPIMARWPYSITGELALTSGQGATQYPDATFQNGVDKPFEIHRMIPRVVALDDAGVMLATQPDQEQLLSLVRAHFVDLGREQLITKVPARLSALVKGSSERTWEFAEPMYLVRSEQIQTTLESLVFPAIADLESLTVIIDLQGFLCILDKPDGNR